MPAVNPKIAEEFHLYLEKAIHEKQPNLIATEMVQDLQPAVDLIRKKWR